MSAPHGHKAFLKKPTEESPWYSLKAMPEFKEIREVTSYTRPPGVYFDKNLTNGQTLLIKIKTYFLIGTHGCQLTEIGSYCYLPIKY